MPPSPNNSNLPTDGDATDGTVWHAMKDFAPPQPGEVCEAFVAGTILVISNIDGELHAMDGICAHQGGPLGKGKLSGCTLTCPWHGWQYNVDSGRQILSEVIAQRTYPIRRQNDTIQVGLASEDLAKEQ